jgi:small subunit ribosomal protein S4
MKQKIKRTYGVREKQFRKHFEDAAKQAGVTGDALLSRLEKRLDNVVYRLGMASSRAQARQLVNHGYFSINGTKTDIPSCEVKVKDHIMLREEKRERKFVGLLKEYRKTKQDEIPGWLAMDESKWEGVVLSEPTRDHIESDLNPQLVVEFYSK